MKRILKRIVSVNKTCTVGLLFLAILPIIYACSIQKKEGSSDKNRDFRVAAYNIRYDAAADKASGNAWQTRKEPLAHLISKYQMDIIGTQEGNKSQVADLKDLIPAYEFIAHPYGGKDGNLHNLAIYYREDLFEMMDSGVFWLSETPDEPSIGWDASDRRICQWGEFKHIPSGHVFYFFNAHFYWRAKEAREASGPLLVSKIQDIAGTHPTIVVGDFNSESETSQIRTIKTVLQDAHEVSRNGRKGLEGTAFPGGVFQGIPKMRIDYVFLSKHYEVHDYQVVSDVYNGDRYPSDHLPVMCRVTPL